MSVVIQVRFFVHMKNNEGRLIGLCLREVLPSVAPQPRHGEKNVTRLDLPRVQMKIDGCRRFFTPSVDDRARALLNGQVKVIDHHLVPPGLDATMADSKGASGCTPMMRNVLPTIEANTGAATLPP